MLYIQRVKISEKSEVKINSFKCFVVNINTPITTTTIKLDCCRECTHNKKKTKVEILNIITIKCENVWQNFN